MRLEEALLCIKPLNEKAMTRAKNKWSSIAKPLGSLGLLEKAMVQIAGITKSDRLCFNKRCVVVMCGDNGVVAQGVTQTGQEVTATVAENMQRGATCVCNMAKVANAQVFPVDIGIYRDVTGDKIIRKKLAYGTKNMTQEPAMTKELAVKAIEVGLDLVLDLKKQGYQMIATGEMGIGNTTTSSAIAAILLKKPVEEVTGRGAGLCSDGLSRKIEAIKEAIAVNRPDENDALDVLAKVGGLDIAGLVGLFIGGAVHGVPVVIDGFISAVAALIAVHLCSDVRAYLIPSHESKEPAGKLLMEALGVTPFIQCELCLGEGTGAVAIMPILDMAAAVYTNMATFEEAAIEEYQPLV